MLYIKEIGFLRQAQQEAIETYLYLRFVKNTPSVIEVYKEFFPDIKEFADTLGFNVSPDAFEYIKTQDEIIKSIKNKAKDYSVLNETLALEYPNYILSLAMGSGKTFIIASIIAIEFSIALNWEKRNQNPQFIKNALVFAQGTTILEELKKIATFPFEKILPPYLLSLFLANVKFIYASVKNKSLQIIENSSWNIVIANSEKFILRANNKENELLSINKKQDSLNANLRLQQIVSLNSLGVFSDEAHHNYGDKIQETLKRVRETLNYIHQKNKIVCVINTTGTPYVKKSILPDVVFWYGLEAGIKNGILKSLKDRIFTYSFHQENQKTTILDILDNFFSFYKQGNEKIAFYFNKQAELDESKPYIEEFCSLNEFSPNIIVTNTMQSTKLEQDEFKTLDEPTNHKRIILLVSKGTEGWDCKTLFATVLVSSASSSKVKVLQSSTRCLRQIEGNIKPASIYLSEENAKILNKELQEYYGSSIDSLKNQDTSSPVKIEVKLLKEKLPKLEITTKTSHIEEDKQRRRLEDILLVKPDISASILRSTQTLQNNQIQDTTQTTYIENKEELSLYLTANLLASNFHLSQLKVYNSLAKIYDKTVPIIHIPYLKEQISEQRRNYKEVERYVTKVLSLIKYGEDGFAKSSEGNYYYHILKFDSSSKKIDLLQYKKEQKYSFHYSPLNFDSSPEKDFHNKLLSLLGENKKDIEDIFFTGGLSSKFTDFSFEYKGVDGKFHQYFPDFLIKKITGELLIVEVKAEKDKDDPTVIAKEKAMKEIRNINKNKIKYTVIYTKSEDIPINNPEYLQVKEFIGE